MLACGLWHIQDDSSLKALCVLMALLWSGMYFQQSGTTCMCIITVISGIIVILYGDSEL